MIRLGWGGVNALWTKLRQQDHTRGHGFPMLANATNRSSRKRTQDGDCSNTPPKGNCSSSNRRRCGMSLLNFCSRLPLVSLAVISACSRQPFGSDSLSTSLGEGKTISMFRRGLPATLRIADSSKSSQDSTIRTGNMPTQGPVKPEPRTASSISEYLLAAPALRVS